MLPSRLSASPISPFYNKTACQRVDKVFVNDEHLPSCIAYDIDAGWAQQKLDGVFKPKVHGTIRVTEKPKPIWEQADG
jgi:hypothetical protein